MIYWDVPFVPSIEKPMLHRDNPCATDRDRRYNQRVQLARAPCAQPHWHPLEPAHCIRQERLSGWWIWNTDWIATGRIDISRVEWSGAFSDANS